jgi:uncharacterized protein (AIM24 family)
LEPKIIGTVLPVPELSMQPGDKVFAESGQLAWMSMAIQMMTSTSAGGQQGGFMGALGRAVAESVQFNITTIPGIKNAFFGGDGIFLAALTGLGRVWLQSMTMQHLAHAIQEYLPHKESGTSSLVGDILRGG